MKRTLNALLLVTLLALAFGAQGVSPASAATLVYSEDFESGYANWSMSGLWNAESQAETCGSSKAPFPSPSNAAYYGTGSCNFDVGDTSGSLTMVSSIALPASGTTTLSFYHYAQTECGDICSQYPGYIDAGAVEISTNGGASWSYVMSPNIGTGWYQRTYDLSAYNGQSVLIRFNFSSGDYLYNNYFGWMIDDISITNSASSDTTPPVVTVPSDITAEATSPTGAVVNFSVSATDETSPANPSVTCDWPSGSTFPLGTTPVTCSATDDASNTGYGYFNVTVQDTTAPSVTVPSDITAEATSASGAVVNFSVSATDSVSPANPTVTCDWNDGDTFPLGTTPVTCSATDDASNTGYGYFNVTVQDTTPPVTVFDSTPPSLTNSTSATFTFHSTDAVSHPANIQHVCYVDSGPNWSNCSSPLNLNSLSEGFHVIWVYAVDEAGNDNYANAIAYGWTVDTTAPSFGLVADNPYEATGPGGANAAYNASFSDDNGVASGSCTPASGSLFPIGTTTVNCTATDNAGNTANTSFGIQVVDSTAPTLNLPANITTPQTNPSGAVVNFSASANDLVDASPNVSCTPASGSNFPLGTTTVNCSATDDYSNTSNGSFTVTVFAWTSASFTSVGAYDGTIFETNELSGLGGAPNISGGFLDVGDMTLDRQVKSLMHFDTSTLPDGAVVLGLTLQLKRYQIVGTDPFTLLGDLNVDIASPYFGVEMAFRQGDFQATASEANVGTFNPAPLAGNWYEAMLGSGAFPHLNLSGPTQFRLHFTLDDNDDLQNDFIRFYSGNAPIAGYRPVLVVYYYIP